MTTLQYIVRIFEGVAVLPAVLKELREIRAEQKRQSDLQDEFRTDVMRAFNGVADDLSDIFTLVKDIHRQIVPGPAVVFEFEFTDSSGNTQTLKDGETMNLPRNSTTHVKAVAYDSTDPATRNVAVLDGPAEVTLTGDEGVHTLQNISETGLEFDIIAGAKAGSSLLNLKGDAKIGEGVVDVVGSEAILTPPGEAVVVELQFGEPTSNA